MGEREAQAQDARLDELIKAVAYQAGGYFGALHASAAMDALHEYIASIRVLAPGAGVRQPDGLTFSALRCANVARLPQFKNRKGEPAHSRPDGSDWSLAEWCNAVTGELGEAANLIKKIQRGDVSLDEARADLAEEFADVVTYMDLLAFRAGVDLGAATAVKWNRVSERVGCDLRLNGAAPAVQQPDAGLRERIISLADELIPLVTRDDLDGGEWEDAWGGPVPALLDALLRAGLATRCICEADSPEHRPDCPLGRKAYDETLRRLRSDTRARLERATRDAALAAAPSGPPNIEAVAAVVHQAYLDTCKRLGWDVRPENRVPYDALPENSKELDRATVRAVFAAIAAPSGPTDAQIVEILLRWWRSTASDANERTCRALRELFAAPSGPADLA